MNNPLQRAEQAKRLLENDLMIEAREHMRESLTRALWKRHTLPAEDRDRLDAMVRYHDSFWSWFDRVLADGKVAEFEEQQKAQAEGVMQRLREKFKV
jgi:hypothetical protein